MALILPNTIVNGENADATEVQGNFDAIKSYVDSNVILANGSVAMAAPLLLLNADPTADRHAARKKYVDAKADALNADKVTKSGDTMDGLLIASGSVQLPVQGGTTGLPLASQAIRKDYADSVYINKTGDAMTGALGLPSTQSTAATAAVHKGYVDGNFLKQTTDTMSGSLTVNGLLVASGQVQLPATAPTSVQAVRRDYADSRYVNNTGDLITGNLTVGESPDSTVPTAGVELFAVGAIEVVRPADATVTQANITIGRGGSPGAGTNSQYVKFTRGAATIGSITIDSATTTAFNTTSDERTKHRDGDITDAAVRVQRLGALAFRGQILDDQGNPDGTVRDLIYAHDVAVEAPYVVNGERGGPEMQTVNFTGLIPLLLAALADALDRIEALEDA